MKLRNSTKLFVVTVIFFITGSLSAQESSSFSGYHFLINKLITSDASAKKNPSSRMSVNEIPEIARKGDIILFRPPSYSGVLCDYSQQILKYSHHKDNDSVSCVYIGSNRTFK